MKVVLETDGNGLSKLSEKSQLDLENGLANYNHSEAEIDETAECADDKFYEVEKIIGVRLNKQYHPRGTKCASKDMALKTICGFQVLPSENLFNFRLFQREGAARKHRAKDEGEVEVQQRKKIKRSNGTTANSANSESDKRKKKDVPGGKIPLPKKKSPFTKTGEKKKKKLDGKNVRKSLRRQSPPDFNSSGSDLETHFAPQTRRKRRRKTPSEKPGREADESINSTFEKR